MYDIALVGSHLTLFCPVHDFLLVRETLFEVCKHLLKFMNFLFVNTYSDFWFLEFINILKNYLNILKSDLLNLMKILTILI